MLPFPPGCGRRDRGTVPCRIRVQNNRLLLPQLPELLLDSCTKAPQVCWISGLKPLLNIFRDPRSLTALICHTTMNCCIYKRDGARFFSELHSDRARGKSQAAAMAVVTRYKEELLLQEHGSAQERGPGESVESPP